MEYEAMLFGLSVGMGAALYLCYELLAALRMFFFRHKAVWNALDALYWIGAGFFVFYMVYRFNQGILRSFLFLEISLSMDLQQDSRAVIGQADRPVIGNLCLSYKKYDKEVAIFSWKM